MSIAIFYDTETTGLPDWSQPSEAPHQPHIVQLAAQLVNLDTRHVISSMDVIIRPDGWTIPEEVAAVHGITTEMALDLGVPEHLAIEMFMGMWSNRLRIAHNEQFDARILRIWLMRHFSEAMADEFKVGQAQCTARMSTKILALPPTEKMKAARRFHNKTPNLGEAYEYFTGKPLSGAHNAMVDVDACKVVYFGALEHVTTEAA